MRRILNEMGLLLILLQRQYPTETLLIAQVQLLARKMRHYIEGGR